MTRSILVMVSIDTEEDNWRPCRDGVTVDNVRELPRLDTLLRQLGVRATYFTTYQVALRDWAVATLQELQAGGAEIGAHLHPWNTPPLEEPFLPRNSMLTNVPAALQLAKLECLTETLRRAIGVAPVVFRAGRYALGPETVGALVRCGYQVDSSVTPFVSWEATDDGPTFVGAPLAVYRTDPGRDVRVSEPFGPLVEVPITCGYTRFSSTRWPLVHRLLHARAVRAVHLPGVCARLGVVKRTILNPEFESVRDMLALSRGALEGGVHHLHLFFHSVALRAGLMPWVSAAADVERLYATIARYLEGLSKMVSFRFATVSEAAERQQPTLAHAVHA